VFTVESAEMLSRRYMQLNRKAFICCDKTVTKGEVAPAHAVKAYRGSRGIAPLILKLGDRPIYEHGTLVKRTTRRTCPRTLHFSCILIWTFHLRLNVMFRLRGSTSGPDKTDIILQRPGISSDSTGNIFYRVPKHCSCHGNCNSVI